MQLTENYVSIPKKLIVELRDNPLALALYFFIARLALVRQQPIPLSRGDIRLFDPAARIGAIKRALDRLVQEGWLIESAGVGHKSSYWPTWGTSRLGVAYRWNIAAERLGCPMYIWCDAIRIDRALLDLFMGKFLPHTRNAHVESYFTRPLLRLHDIGSYILFAAGMPADATDELVRWGLVRDGQAQLVPDDAVVLALASQRASVGGFQLTAAGWRKLGWFGARPSRPTQPEVAEAVPLIFVLREQIGCRIGELIGQLIGGALPEQRPASPSQSQGIAIDCTAPTMTGITKDSQDSRDATPNPLHTTDQQGGGFISLDQKKSTRRPPREAEDGGALDEQVAGGERAASNRHNGTGEQNETPLPDTEAVRLLWAVGARNRERLAALSDTPVARVEEVIAAAQARRAVVDKAGWAIAALSEGWDIAPPRGKEDRETPIMVTDYIGGHYGDLFRLGSDTSDLDERADHLECMQPGDQTHVAGAAPTPMQPGAGAAIHTCHSDLKPLQRHAAIQAALPRPAAHHSAAELTQEVRSALLLRCGRSHRRLITSLHVRARGDTTVIHCASLADRLAVLDALMGALRRISADLGLPATIRVIDHAPPPDKEPPDGDVWPSTEIPLSA